MIAQYVNELPEDLQVLLAMRSTFQVWFDNSRYLQSISAEGLKQDGVEWFCTSNTFSYTVLRQSGRPFVSLYFTVADNGLELTLMVQNYSHGKLMDTKALEGVAFSVEDFRVLLDTVPQPAYVPILRSLPFFFTLIGLESQFQGYQNRYALLNGWI
jgi:hypothetical protein